MKRDHRSLHTLKSIQSIRTGETRTSFRSYSPYRLEITVKFYYAI